MKFVSKNKNVKDCQMGSRSFVEKIKSSQQYLIAQKLSGCFKKLMTGAVFVCTKISFDLKFEYNENYDDNSGRDYEKNVK